MRIAYRSSRSPRRRQTRAGRRGSRSTGQNRTREIRKIDEYPYTKNACL